MTEPSFFEQLAQRNIKRRRNFICLIAIAILVIMINFLIFGRTSYDWLVALVLLLFAGIDCLEIKITRRKIAEGSYTLDDLKDWSDG